jgi:endonuclease/exonuclease/phosphatase (EEP) superfamily protein YafD
LYLPQQVWLLPLPVLALPCLVIRPWLLGVHLSTALAVLLLLMGFRWALLPARATPSIKVLTNNIGQKGGERLTPLVEQEAPDLIVMQEAKGRGPGYARQYPAHHTVWHGEFGLVSRVPVLDSGPVEGLAWGTLPVAVRYVLDFDGRRLVLYNVHLPTPREYLQRLKGRGLLSEIKRSLLGRRAPAHADSLQDYIRTHTTLAAALRDRLDAESDPVVVAGDLNVPPLGRAYRTLRGSLTDAFAARGRGFGFSFPGTTRNPLSLFGPWLRLDYVLCGNRIRPVACRVEPHRRAQHRAVLATLAWE